MLLSTLDRSQPLFYFVPQDSHSQAGSTSPRLASNLTPNNKIASSLITAQKDQDHSTKESMQASISEDALAALQKKGQQASSSARGLYNSQKYRPCFQVFFSLQDEDETSFAQEMTVPRSYSDGNLVRFVR